MNARNLCVFSSDEVFGKHNVLLDVFVCDFELLDCFLGVSFREALLVGPLGTSVLLRVLLFAVLPSGISVV